MLLELILLESRGDVRRVECRVFRQVRLTERVPDGEIDSVGFVGLIRVARDGVDAPLGVEVDVSRLAARVERVARRAVQLGLDRRAEGVVAAEPLAGGAGEGVVALFEFGGVERAARAV